MCRLKTTRKAIVQTKSSTLISIKSSAVFYLRSPLASLPGADPILWLRYESHLPLRWWWCRWSSSLESQQQGRLQKEWGCSLEQWWQDDKTKGSAGEGHDCQVECDAAGEGRVGCNCAIVQLSLRMRDGWNEETHSQGRWEVSDRGQTDCWRLPNPQWIRDNIYWCNPDPVIGDWTMRK